MLTFEDLRNVDADADAFLARHDGETKSLFALCLCATGRPPRFRAQREEGRLDDEGVWLREGLSRARAHVVLGHEIAHVFYDRVGYYGRDLEARCDAFSARITLRRSAVYAAMREVAHSYMSLADHFQVTQSCALLRIGELTGRPVCLLRSFDTIARGDAYGWPEPSMLMQVMRGRRHEVHPVKITDEPGRLGFMLHRSAWSETTRAPSL